MPSAVSSPNPLALPPAVAAAHSAQRGQPHPGQTHSGQEFRALAGGRTPLTADQASAHLAAAWQAEHGAPPSPRTTAILTAQWALETGRGRHMRGHNFGGIKATADEARAVMWTTEGAGNTVRRVRGAFRTYGNAAEGARDYVRTLSRRYPLAVNAAQNGDVHGFVRALAARTYFTADASVYARSMAQLTAEYSRGVSGGTRTALQPSAVSRPDAVSRSSFEPGFGPDVAAPEWAVEGVSRMLWKAIWARRA